MLKRQSWSTVNLNSHLLTRSLPAASHRYQPTVQRRCLHLLAPDDRAYGPSAVGNLPLRKRKDSAKLKERSKAGTQARVEIERSHQRKSPETWINPSSLSESLEAHRWANRNGLARDGVPIVNSGRKKYHHAGTKRLFIPQFGVKHLSLADHVAYTGRGPRLFGGVCPPLSPEWMPSDAMPYQLRMPWMTNVVASDQTLDTVSSALRLNDEVKAFETYFSPTLSERKAAADAFDHIRRIATELIEPDARINLIGSRAAGTDSPLSDVDINIKFNGKAKDEQSPKLSRNKLHKLFLAMRATQARQTLLMHTFLDKANVPVINGTHLPSGLEFQIQSNDSSHDSLEVSRAYVAEYPAVRGLFHILKQMLNIRGLNNGFTGGLTSYPLLNMIVMALKLGHPRIEFENAGTQLLHFLDFWSRVNLDKQRITLIERDEKGIDPVSVVPLVSTNSRTATRHQFLMTLDDPADPINNLGKSASRIKHIQACFITAREKIRWAMQQWDDSAHHQGLRDQHSSTLAWCLEADYSSYEEARQRLRRYSQQVVTC